MIDPPVEPRAVAALAEAIDAAVDTWDDGNRPAWIKADPDRRALAEAVMALLSQHGFTVTAIVPQNDSSPTDDAVRDR